MTAFALIFTLAAIGISETNYLISKRVALSAPVCPIGDDCSVVLESKYDKIFLVPNDLLGLIFYFVVLAIAALLVIGTAPFSLPLSFFALILKIAVLVGSLMSLYFVYLQWHIIKAWCFWCVMSACTIWLMAFIILVSGQI